jgi:hypothetical protein
VEQVEIDVLKAQTREARVERAKRRVVPLVVVPELRGDEDLVARDAAESTRGWRGEWSRS